MSPYLESKFPSRACEGLGAVAPGATHARPGLKRPAGALVLGLVLMLGLVMGPGILRLRAAASPRNDGVAQAQAGQEQLRQGTARVGAQLDLILEETRRNGITGEDVQLLGAIRGILGQLSEADMVAVISLLQEARGNLEGGVQRARLLDAFSTQKTVGVKLRQILMEYQRQQELSGIAARLEELAARQHVAMRDVRELAASVAGRKKEWLAENHRISLQLQVSEQQSLRDEVEAVIRRLTGWKSEDEEDDSAARAAEVLRDPAVIQLARRLDRVVLDLNQGLMLSAAGGQREVRGLLREVARQLQPPQDELDALQASLHEVEGLLGRQEETQASTRALPDRAAKLEPLVRSLAELVDDTDVARLASARVDNEVAEQIGAAVGRMQEARGALEGATGEWRARRLAATTQQELAVARLETARRILQERIDALEKRREAMVDPMSNLKQVRDDVAELLRREQELKAAAAEVATDPAKLRPMAPSQGDIGDRSEDTARRAAVDSTEAAEQIAEATAQMRRSQRSLGEGRNEAGAQQAAVDALSRALAILDEQMAALEAAEKELADLEKLLQELIALIERQKKLNAETARLARKMSGREPKVVGTDQNAIASATRDLEGRVPPSVPQAATYLGDGATQMVLAGNELGSARAAEARPAQDEALENLLRARRELEERIAQLKDMLGEPAEEASLEELAKMVKEAQHDTTEALAADQMPKKATGLHEAGEHIEPATSGRMGRVPRMIRDALQQADRSLQEGSASAEAGDGASADREGAKAQEALAAAAAALDLAMAGMGQQPGEGEGQGGQGKNPSASQGRGRGKKPGAVAGKGTGDAGNFFGAGGADGPKRAAAGGGKFIGLPARERAALLQSQGERYPQEYAPQIEQYLKNLSDQVQGAPR
ncbi:MAG: hypothetical protein IT580_01250 [Verrucomicrobiales bacterium]|nr:hypothetical protein [Verrucomicrobiales bacterium]